MEHTGEAHLVDIGELWDGEKAIRLVEKLLKELSRHAKIKSVIITGSRAKATWKRTSDVDLIIISSNRSLGKMLPKIEGFGTIDPRPYTWQELLEGLIEGEVELIEAFEDGKVIQDDGTWREAGKIYREVKKLLGIERYKEGWRIKRRIPKEELQKTLGL